MELGLTLGGRRGDPTSAAASSSFTPFYKSTDLALGLGICSGKRHHHREGPRSNGDRTVSVDSPRLHLDLLPRWFPHETANTAEEVGAASSPNSAASAFPVDFCIFRGEERRDTTEAAARCGGEQRGERTTSSRASEEDENCHTRKKLRLAKEQAAFLEESFKERNTLNTKQKEALAKQLNLRPRQVEVWFQNRRARTKLKQTEVDCDYLKRCCETLTEENGRLRKEIQELRALKSFNPYNMQLPATTLTMCPSCKRTTAITTVTTAITTVATSSENAAANPSIIASNNTAEPSSKVAPFPLSSPNFFPFSSHNNQPQKSVAS